jgi:hypothetical protein
MCSYITIE